MPEEWARYWSDSLADSGVVGLTPLRPGSWHVPVAGFATAVVLGRYLDAVVRGWGGPAALTDPDARPVLDGGLALRWGGDMLVEPGCCGDLGNLSEWREAAAYRQPEWKMVWVRGPDCGRAQRQQHRERDRTAHPHRIVSREGSRLTRPLHASSRRGPAPTRSARGSPCRGPRSAWGGR